jgi:hypothetical protein
VGDPFYSGRPAVVFFRLNLTALLAALAVLDLLVDRVLTRLFLPPSTLENPLARVLVGVASFLSYLGGALALLLFATSFLGLIRRRELYPRSLRMVASILAVFFVLLFIGCVSTYPGSPRLFIQLRTSQAFFAWLTMMAVWRAVLPGRTKVGITLFMLPIVLHTAALFLGEISATRNGALPGQLARIGEIVAFLAAGAAPLLLPGSLRGTRAGWGVWLAGAAAVVALGALAFFKFDLMQMLGLYGLRLELPPLAVPGAWAYLLLLALATFGTVTAVLPALKGGGADRLLAYGIIMVVTTGYQIASPMDLAIATAGLLAMAVGVSRRGLDAPPAPPVLGASAPAPVAA